MSSKLHKVGVVMVLFLGMTLSFGTSWVAADEQKKEKSGAVQERAVPRQPLGQTSTPCLCYEGRGTCVGSTKETCKPGPRHPCSGTCRFGTPPASGGSLTIR